MVWGYDLALKSSPAGTPGMIIEPAYRKLGWHASDTHGITLTDCRVPSANMLGPRGSGLRNFLTILGMTLLFATDSHHLVIAALNESYRYNDRGQLVPILGKIQSILAEDSPNIWLVSGAVMKSPSAPSFRLPAL